jgi:protein-S-isoprenylcysteine O-methyltransferase Ste14
MRDSTKKAFQGLVGLVISLALLLFLPAWTLYYWQGWIFLAVFTVSVSAITVYLVRKDPKLLVRRLNAGPTAEKETLQKVIQFFALIAFIAVVIVPPIDHRFGWSAVPPYVSVIGNLLVALGLVVIFFVFRANTYASAAIEVTADQRLITNGPYAFVRHPMYFGALVMLIGVPLALGSYWGLLTVIPITLVLIWRLVDEEKVLARELAGYVQYQIQVRQRLLPFIW